MYNIGLITLTFFCSFLIVFSLTMVIFIIVLLTCAKPSKKTEVKMRNRRSDLTDRKVNDFIRSVLIEDDGQYELLARTLPDFRNNRGYEVTNTLNKEEQEQQYDYGYPKPFCISKH